jgi:hypothetical protein
MKNSNLQLLSDFANASDELLKLKVITTDSFTGEIGEFIACYHFKLIKAPKVTKEIDATDANGNHYQVKSKVISNGNFGYRISGLNPKSFEYLVVVYFDELYNPLKILKINAKGISGSEYNIPANVTINQNTSIIEGSAIKVPAKVKSAITKFAESYNALKTQNIIRTRHVVGDLGEYYACEKLGLKINEKSNEKGIDAIHPTNGLTFEVKTRRVYQSERREGEVRRLNGLTGKSADYLVVVTLDWEFKCSGMWIMPMKNIINPKSAHLTIVNNTKGVESVVPSQVDWLKTASKFSGFGNKKRAVSKSVLPDSGTKNSFLAKSNTKTKAQVNSNRRKYSWMADDHWDNVEPYEKPIENPYPIYPKPRPFSKAESILKQINGLLWFLLFGAFFFSLMFRGCF